MAHAMQQVGSKEGEQMKAKTHLKAGEETKPKIPPAYNLPKLTHKKHAKEY
jgi:hypothetical protein